MRAAVKWLLVLLLVNPAMASPAQAAPGSAAAQCRVEASPLVFGAYQVFSRSDTVAVGKIAYTCTASVPVRINLNYGASGLKNQAGQATYEICLDPGCGAVWGDGSHGTQFYFDPAPPINRPAVVYFYGRVPDLQDLAIGSYGASVSATVNW